MKKTLLITLLGASLALTGCVQLTPAGNQNLSQPATNVNSSSNNYRSYLDWQLSVNYPDTTYPPDWYKSSRQYFDGCSENINLAGGTNSLKADANLSSKFLKSLQYSLLDHGYINPIYPSGYIGEVCLDATSKKIFYFIAVENVGGSRLAVYDGKTHNIIDSLKLNIGGNSGCRLVGYSQNNNLLFYDCGWGDGPVHYSTLYSINLKNNDIKTYERCDTGPDENDRAITTCSVTK